MRVIAGSAKGRKLLAPRGPGTRPALSQVKEAIFNILYDVGGSTVLDLFAGSGSIGIEALSRGAAQASFVEQAPQALKALRRNVETCGFVSQADIVPLPVARVLRHLNRKNRSFDLIFIDPPYDQDQVMPTVRLAEKVLADNGVLVIEHSPREPVIETAKLTIGDQRKYGQTIITFLKLKYV